MINKSQIGIVIVLYKEEPPYYIFENKECNYIIIDNTPDRVLSLPQEHVTYIPLKKNTGIANALNVGVKDAISKGLLWVITMDQDSLLPPNMIDEYIGFVNRTNENVGVLSPLINMYDGENKKASRTFEIINEALTSGSMINTKVYQEVGGFKKEMFIDVVDFEFCWNVRNHGYQIVQLNSVVMQHHLGNTVEYRLFGMHLFYVTNHNKLRRYYMERNMLYLHKLYPMYRPSLIKAIFNRVVGITKILFFEKDCYQKIRAIFLAYQDYRNGIMGECQHNL